MKNTTKRIHVSYADKIYQAKVERISFVKLIANIKIGEFRKNINEIRKEQDKAKRNEMKQSLLPYFTTARFKKNYRRNDNFLYSKFMVFDIDNITKKKIKKIKRMIRRNRDVFCSFVSPSNNGLKLIYKLSRNVADVNEYKDIYHYYSNLIKAKFKVEVDNTSDPARTCYVSYDPELIYCPNCKTIDVDAISVKVRNISYKKITEISVDLSYLPELINFLTDKINNYKDWNKCGFALASLGERGRQHYLNLSVNNPNYTDKEKELIVTFDELVRRYDPKRSSIKSIFQLAQQKGYEFKKYIEFWRYENEKLEINRTALLKFLEMRGFFRIELHNKYHKVYLINNMLMEVDTAYIINNVIEHLKLTNNSIVEEKLLKGVTVIFNERLLELLPLKSFSFNSDTEDKSFIYFKNCYVEISPDSIRRKDYSKLKGVIWKDHIRDRDFKFSHNDSVFRTFVNNICRNKKNRIRALMSHIGYLLHTYKDSTKAKAIIFCDEKVSEGAFGRSGKSLVGKAISQLRNVTVIGGKRFNFESNFAFQEVILDTQIIHFNDVKRDFQFENLFSDITDGLSVEKKYMGSFKIPFEHSPKFLISTNYVIQGEDDSTLGRKSEIEFSDFYSLKHEPKDDFGKLFFNWDEGEWNSFDLFMMKCLKLYLKKGLIQYKHINLKFRKLREATCTEFADFIETVNKKKEKNVAALYDKFIDRNNDFENWLKQNTFSKWIGLYGEIYGYDIRQRYSSGRKFIKFQKVKR